MLTLVTFSESLICLIICLERYQLFQENCCKFFLPFTICSSFHLSFKSNIIKENAKYLFCFSRCIKKNCDKKNSSSHLSRCIPWTISARQKGHIIIDDDACLFCHCFAHFCFDLRNALNSLYKSCRLCRYFALCFLF